MRQERTGGDWKGHLSRIHKGVESRGGDRSGKEGIGLDRFLIQASTWDRKGGEGIGQDWIGLDRKGFPSCVHKGRDGMR